MEETKEVIESNILLLKQLQNNFKRNPNRRYLENTLKDKLNFLKTTYECIITNLAKLESNLSECQVTYYTNVTKNLYNEIYSIINQKLTNSSERPKLKTLVNVAIFCKRISKISKDRKMTSQIEIIKVITSLVPFYDGKPEKLNNVISSLNACKALLTDANKEVAIQTILSRLEGKARAAVTDNPVSVDVIINKLKEKCSTSTAPSTIIAKLNAIKQGDSFEKFTEKIEKLTLDLERTYLSENVPFDTAVKLATSAGIKALTDGIKNSETKLLLKAGQFDTLTKAVEKASENEAGNHANNTANVFAYQKKNDQSQRGRGSFQQFRNNGNRNGQNHGNYQNNHGNYQNNNGNYHNFQRNNGNFRNFQSNRGNFSQNRPRFGNYQNNFQQPGNSNYQNRNRPRGPNMYYMVSENQLAPQQAPVGGQRIIQATPQQQIQHLNPCQVTMSSIGNLPRQ